ncbi:MAG: FAD/NAD(P)-binding protein [Streptosporangiaceae bacterium]
MTRTVAIIGFGSRGLGVLERIAALAAAGASEIRIEIIDPAGTGAGVHGAGQPDYLLLNTTCGQISMFPGQLSVGARTAGNGPSLYDWAVARGLRLAPDGFSVGPGGRELRPTDFLPRRVLGEYLAWFFEQLRGSLPRSIGLVTHRTEAVDIRLGTAGGLVIELADGGSVPADYAFLTTGYTPNTAKDIDGLIAEPYPLPERLAVIAPGQSVAVGGFGLSAMDVISCLTVGRGGRFRRDQGDAEYLPGGGEPRIVMYSRSGVPCRARPLVTRFEISYDPLVFTTAAIDALRDATGAELDFSADIMPLILTEMRTAYRRCQARCDGPEAETALVAELQALAATPAINARLDELDAERGRFDAAAAFAGEAGIRLGDAAAYQRWFCDTLRRDLGEGLLGFAWSPVKAALDIFRELRDTLRYVADFAGLTPASRDDFYRRVVPLMNRAVVGPQYERHAELLALMAAGLVEVPLGPAPLIEKEADHWTLASTRLASPERREVDWLVPAQVPLPAAADSASPLLSALARKGWIRPSRPGSRLVPGIDVDRDQHPLDASGQPNPRVWVLGPLCEGATFYNNLVPSPGVFSRPVADAHRCAAAMLAAPAPAPAPASAPAPAPDRDPAASPVLSDQRYPASVIRARCPGPADSSPRPSSTPPCTTRR